MGAPSLFCVACEGGFLHGPPCTPQEPPLLERRAQRRGVGVPLATLQRNAWLEIVKGKRLVYACVGIDATAL